MSKYFENFPLTQYDMFFNGQKTDVVDLFRIVKVKKEFKDDVTFYTYYDVQDGERPDIVSTKLYGSPNYYWTFFMVNDHLVNTFRDWPLSSVGVQELIEHKYAGVVLNTDENISTRFSTNTIFEGLISGARGRLLEKDPTLGIIKIELISGNFLNNEIIRDLISNEFISITGQSAFKDAVHHYENADGKYVNRGTVGAIPITNEEYEFFVNDEKSKIKIIRPTYIQAIADQFIDQIKSSEE